jgi:hypothetical protein
VPAIIPAVDTFTYYLSIGAGILVTLGLLALLLTKVFNAGVSFIALSWVPIVLLFLCSNLAYINDDADDFLSSIVVSLSFLLSASGIVLVVQAYRRNELWGTLFVATCLSSLPAVVFFIYTAFGLLFFF